MLKNGDKFPTTTLYITPRGNSLKDTIGYIERWGADNLNNKQLSFDFSQRTNDPDHCVYFALRNLGINNVPVYVNYDTYELGNELGLFSV